jgi:hypothetical protein
MVVTDLNYFLEKALIGKLDLMIDRCTQKHPKKDAVLIMEGAEGEGKTNSAVACAYYIKDKTKRDIHLFFRLKSLVEFAQNTKEKIIIWDEPALDALGTDWYKETNKDLIRLLMMCRKNRHFFIFCFTKFHKFSEYVVVDRALGMVHMYSRREIQAGRCVYIKIRNLERLFLGYKTTKKRLYRRLASLRGSFPEVLEKYFDKMGIYVENKLALYSDYEKEKDKAIQSIGKQVGKVEKDNRDKIELWKLRKAIGSAEFPIKNKESLSKYLGIDRKRIYEWANYDLNKLNKDNDTNNRRATDTNGITGLKNDDDLGKDEDEDD